MKKVIICLGLPGSGKSTWAKQEQLQQNQNTLILNRDSLRNMLCGKWSAKYESIVKQSELNILKIILESDFEGHIIIDDTNLNPKTLNSIIGTCTKCGIYDIEFKSFLDCPVVDCIERDAKRERKVGETAIIEMSKKIPELKKLLHI